MYSAFTRMGHFRPSRSTPVRARSLCGGLCAEWRPDRGGGLRLHLFLRVLPNRNLSVISASLPTLAQPLLDVITANGRFVYTSNAGTSSISGFEIGNNGALTAIGKPLWHKSGRKHQLGHCRQCQRKVRLYLNSGPDQSESSRSTTMAAWMASVGGWSTCGHGDERDRRLLRLIEREPCGARPARLPAKRGRASSLGRHS